MKTTKKQIVIISILLIIFSPFFYFMYVYNECYDIIGSEKDYRPNLSTRIYDIRGELISELFVENRNLIDIKEVPVVVRKAFVATEDRDFYKHTGVDLLSILRAFVVDIISGEIKQGGSTITQQLVKQLYTRSEKTFRRKILELLISREFEERYSKDKILEMYLNQVYFGHGVYGIKSAARFYLESAVGSLDIVGAALLAGIPSAPNRYSPLKNPRIAFERHKQVLYNVIASGYIEKSEAIEKFNRFWDTFLEKTKTRFPSAGIRNQRFDRAPHFTEYIRRLLVKRFGEEKVYQAGYSVYTTLDLRCQEAARSVLYKGLEKQNQISGHYNRYKFRNIDHILLNEAYKKKKKKKKGELSSATRFLQKFREEYADTLNLATLFFTVPGMRKSMNDYLETHEKMRLAGKVQGAIIALDPATGGIVTMLGGSDFAGNNQLNRAVQCLRQPGSSFKAFIYGAGIETKKITAATAFLDAPIIYRGTRRIWSPSNYGKTYRGKVLVRRAFAASLNIISVLAYERIGADPIAQFASKITGIPVKRFEIDPTIALGTSEVSPLEMARGYAVYANKGMNVVPYSIRYICDIKGNKIYDEDAKRSSIERKQVVSPQTAFIMTSLMRSVVDSGTASGAIRSRAGFRLPAAGKTGTNTEYRDAWFVGYTPDLVAAVWVGCDSPKFSLGPGQGGAAVAAPIWGLYMKKVYSFRKIKKFPAPPKGISSRSVCTKTGLIPVKGCSVKSEYFISGTGPGGICNSAHAEIISVFELAKRRVEGMTRNELQKKSFLSDSEEEKTTVMDTRSE